MSKKKDMKKLVQESNEESQNNFYEFMINMFKIRGPFNKKN